MSVCEDVNENEVRPGARAIDSLYLGGSGWGDCEARQAGHGLRKHQITGMGENRVS